MGGHVRFHACQELLGRLALVAGRAKIAGQELGQAEHFGRRFFVGGNRRDEFSQPLGDLALDRDASRRPCLLIPGCGPRADAGLGRLRLFFCTVPPGITGRRLGIGRLRAVDFLPGGPLNGRIVSLGSERNSPVPVVLRQCLPPSDGQVGCRVRRVGCQRLFGLGDRLASWFRCST